MCEQIDCEDLAWSFILVSILKKDPKYIPSCRKIVDKVHLKKAYFEKLISQYFYFYKNKNIRFMDKIYKIKPQNKNWKRLELRSKKYIAYVNKIYATDNHSINKYLIVKYLYI